MDKVSNCFFKQYRCEVIAEAGTAFYFQHKYKERNMYNLSSTDVTVISGGNVKDPGACASAMMDSGGFGAGFGAVIGGLVGAPFGGVGAAFGAVIGASLFGAGSSAVAAQGSACQPELVCTPDNLH